MIWISQCLQELSASKDIATIRCQDELPLSLDSNLSGPMIWQVLHHGKHNACDNIPVSISGRTPKTTSVACLVNRCSVKVLLIQLLVETAKKDALRFVARTSCR